MDIKEAYITNIICHHFSLDSTQCLANDKEMNLEELDMDILKEFFIKPFGFQKNEYQFTHHINLLYNVVYQLSLKIFQNGNFVQSSKDIYKHLISVSILPTIKDGDIFITKINDIKIDNSYYEALGIFKIETKSEFIETFVDNEGIMQFTVKKGFASNKIDKACMIVFTNQLPLCYIIDTSKDSKFWRQDFLGLIPKANNYSQSKNLLEVFKNFITQELPTTNLDRKSNQIELINKSIETLKSSENISIDTAASIIFNDPKMLDKFADYRKAYEEKEKITFDNHFIIDKKAISLTKSARRIKLDDVAELYLMKTGDFLERGYDNSRGMNYYKIFFSIEK